MVEFQDFILLPIAEYLNNSSLSEQRLLFHTQQEIPVNRDLFFIHRDVNISHPRKVRLLKHDSSTQLSLYIYTGSEAPWEVQGCCHEAVTYQLLLTLIIKSWLCYCVTLGKLLNLSSVLQFLICKVAMKIIAPHPH